MPTVAQLIKALPETEPTTLPPSPPPDLLAALSLRPVPVGRLRRAGLLGALQAIGLRILVGARGPIPLLTFARRVCEDLDYPRPVPLPHFAAALKCLIQNMDQEHLRILSPSEMLGVGYVYNAADPATWPVSHFPTVPSAAAL